MNTRAQAKALTLSFLFLFSTAVASAQEVSPAFFDTETINKILSHRNCEGIRFYKVLKPGSTEISAMAIGIRNDKSEISNLTNRYYVFTKVTSEGLNLDKLSQNKAAEACQRLKDSGVSPFAASFSKEELTSMLKEVPVGGIVVREKKMQDAAPIFQAQAATMRMGEISPVTSSAIMTSGEPCPTFCGDLRNYVHM